MVGDVYFPRERERSLATAESDEAVVAVADEFFELLNPLVEATLSDHGQGVALRNVQSRMHPEAHLRKRKRCVKEYIERKYIGRSDIIARYMWGMRGIVEKVG